VKMIRTVDRTLRRYKR